MKSAHAMLLLLCCLMCSPGPGPENIEAEKAYANALFEKGLYPQAVSAYWSILRFPGVGANAKAGILLRVAEIQMNNLNEPENALASLIRIKELYPGAPAAQPAAKKMVECLERSGRSLDARYAASRISALKPDSSLPPSAVVAKIEDREVTLAEVEKADGQLGKTRKEREEQVKRFVVTELLYQSGLRRGLNRDPRLLKRLRQIERTLVTTGALEQELGRISIDTAFAEAYFKANAQNYVDSTKTPPKAPAFSEVRPRVLEDMAAKKRKAGYQALMERLLRAEQVKIYSDRIR